MWSAISSMATNAVAATYTGFMGTGEQMPYDCAYPFQKLEKDMSNAEALSQRHFEQATELLDAKDWTPMAMVDPEGGDMKGMERLQIGTYHFVKVQFSVMNTSPADVAEVIKTEDLNIRKKYSVDMNELTPLARGAGNITLLHVGYGVPPPVACRDMLFLVNSAEDEDEETVHVWGCSVDSDLCPEGWNSCVRGATLWMWRFTQVGPHTLVTYFTTFDPRGWAPPFLVAWLKSQAQTEFLAIRAMMSGKEIAAAKETKGFEVSEDELKAAEAQYKEHVEKATAAATA